MSTRRRVLFLSRSFPPVVGGMETHNAALARHLPQHFDTIAVVNPMGRKGLGRYLCRAVWAVLINARKVDAILLGDGVLSVLAPLVRLLAPRVTVVCVLHGLDVTYPNPIYQRLWPGFFQRHMTQLIAVSRATAAAAIERGVPAERLHVIGNGIDLPEHLPSRDQAALCRQLGLSLNGRQVLLLLGRLVRRKGAEWFVREVMPELRGTYLLVIAGDGPERARIEHAIAHAGLEGSVSLLGKVDEDTKLKLLVSADLLVQPNIPVAGDMEGFGLTVLEAAAAGLPVAASRLEGLEDALNEGETGWLVAPGNALAWKELLMQLAHTPEVRAARAQHARERVRESGTWESVVALYAEVINAAAQSGT